MKALCTKAYMSLFGDPLATVGHYPEMSLAEARVKAVEVQRDAKQGRTTTGVRKARQEIEMAAAAERVAEVKQRAEIEHASFRSVSGRWMAEKHPTWALETYRKARLVVDTYLIPKLGELDVRQLETKDVRSVLVEMAKETPNWPARRASISAASLTTRSMRDSARMKVG
jgi:hypothetical protein